MAGTTVFTPAEAAFLLGEPVKVLKKALDAGVVEAKLVRRPGVGLVREIEWPDVVYLHAVQALRDELTVKARAEFYKALKNTEIERVDEIRFGQLRVVIDDFKREMLERRRALEELVAKVEFRSDGEPLLKGTTIEVYRIAALLDGGLAPDEVADDYPSLSRDDIETARAYAGAYPKNGRPYPRTTAKRALAGIGLEALDEEADFEGA